MEVRPFTCLKKKMREYIEERQVIANPFSDRSYPFRSNSSPFAKQPKATPVKKRTVVAKPRKVNVGYYTLAFQWNWIGQTFPTHPKAAKAMSQSSRVLTQQMKALFTFTQPATTTATDPVVPNPLVTISSKTQHYCATCTPLIKQCPTTYPTLLNPNWSNLEGQDEDWNGDRQKEKE